MTRSIDSLKGRELPAVLLAGPTASGKTTLSLALAGALGGKVPAEIVNADSMQIYRHMDVGTAKPSAEERGLVPHHLLDVADPDEPFDAARYLTAARPVIDSLRLRGVLPLVVGGTGLYMRVLTRGICSGPPSDPAVKEELLLLEKTGGLTPLYRELLRVDPESAARIHPNDRQRILRALEVYRIGGVALSALQKPHGFSRELFPTIKIFITREREELYERIERRVEGMISAGLKSEVEGLLSMGYGPELKSMQSIGYRQMAAHIAGTLSLDEAVFAIKRETRRYAKRQITWFGGEADFVSFAAEDFGGIHRFICQRLETGG
ncbi:MAG: tRNA (adenosine(37)-N6)-dimethylallyltransferase MiaA [Syntrophobacteraceae bacterium]